MFVTRLPVVYHTKIIIIIAEIEIVIIASGRPACGRCWRCWRCHCVKHLARALTVTQHILTVILAVASFTILRTNIFRCFISTSAYVNVGNWNALRCIQRGNNLQCSWYLNQLSCQDKKIFMSISSKISKYIFCTLFFATIYAQHWNYFYDTMQKPSWKTNLLFCYLGSNVQVCVLIPYFVILSFKIL